MGRKSTVISAASRTSVWQQPIDNAPEAEAIDTSAPPGDHPITEPEVALLTETNPGTSAPSLLPVGSSDRSAVKADDKWVYDIHVECTDPQDDDYVLVAPESAPKPQQNPSKSTDKGREASEN